MHDSVPADPLQGSARALGPRTLHPLIPHKPPSTAHEKNLLRVYPFRMMIDLASKLHLPRLLSARSHGNRAVRGMRNLAEDRPRTFSHNPGMRWSR